MTEPNSDQHAVLVICERAASCDDAALLIEAFELTATAEGMAPGIRGHRRGCQCSSCRSTRSRAKTRRRAAANPSIIPHGSENGYMHYGCRQECCTTAHAKYARERYQPAGDAHRAEFPLLIGA